MFAPKLLDKLDATKHEVVKKQELVIVVHDL